MGVYDDLSKLDTVSPTPQPAHRPMERKRKIAQKVSIADQSTDQSTNRPTNQLTDQSSNQPTHQSIDQSTNQSTNQIIEVEEIGPVVDRPHAFYLSQKVDHWLDEGVRYLREKGMHKADRSILVNAILHDPALYKPGFLDAMRQKLLAHLTNKSLKRAQ